MVTTNAAASYAAAILAETSLTAYWPLDELTGTNATDRKGAIVPRQHSWTLSGADRLGSGWSSGSAR
jgi:hypothetical protein